MKKYGIPEGYKGRPLTGDEIRAKLQKMKAEEAAKKLKSRGK